MKPIREIGMKMKQARPSINRRGTTPHQRLSELWALLSPRTNEWSGCTKKVLT
jgi:hypothetical protein